MLNSPSHDASKKRCKGTPFSRNKKGIYKKTDKNIGFSCRFRVKLLFLQNIFDKNTNQQTFSDMINRELIRIKIVQLTYAYYQNGNHNMSNAEKELMFSLSKSYDLYNYLLLLIVAINKEMRRRVEVLTARAKREGTPLPSEKFVNNRFALQLEGNKMLLDYIDEKKLTWNDDVDAVRRLCNTIEQSEMYQEYMASEEDSYEADRELWRKIYKTLITENEDLDALLEEKSLYWNDDKEVVDTFVLKTIKRFDEKSASRQELLPEFKVEEWIRSLTPSPSPKVEGR